MRNRWTKSTGNVRFPPVADIVDWNTLLAMKLGVSSRGKWLLLSAVIALVLLTSHPWNRLALAIAAPNEVALAHEENVRSELIVPNFSLLQLFGLLLYLGYRL